MYLLVDSYKELLSRDRSFLVPVINSLGELQLPDELKPQVLGLIERPIEAKIGSSSAREVPGRGLLMLVEAKSEFS